MSANGNAQECASCKRIIDEAQREADNQVEFRRSVEIAMREAQSRIVRALDGSMVDAPDELTTGKGVLSDFIEQHFENAQSA